MPKYDLLKDYKVCYYKYEEVDKEHECRYSLCVRHPNVTKKDLKILVCIGINPSTATDKKLDATLCRVANIAFYPKNKYNCWAMLNIIPLRRTKPDELPTDKDFLKDKKLVKQCERNVRIISDFLSDNTQYISNIWAAWGNSIDKRMYLKQNLIEIYNAVQKITPSGMFSWCCFHNSNDSARTIKGHPRHPLRLSESAEKTDFALAEYIREKIN